MKRRLSIVLLLVVFGESHRLEGPRRHLASFGDPQRFEHEAHHARVTARRRARDDFENEWGPGAA
jgi:hypothetical protein